jgi:multiple sugar transport system substrate-binding protein
MKKRVLILLACMAVLLASCNFPGSESTPIPATLSDFPPRNPLDSPSPALAVSPTPAWTATPVGTHGTVRIWHSWSEVEMPALVQIINGFRAKYPDVLFDVLYVPLDDLRTRYETETREGSGPTLLLGPAEWGPSLYDAGAVAILDERADSSLLDGLNQPALNGAVYHGMLIGLPYSLHGVVLYRNKEIMTISPDNFDELVTLAQASTHGEVIGAILDRGFLYSGAHLNGIGGRLMDANGEPAFVSAEGVAWLNLLRAFEQAGATDYLTSQDLEAFKAGRVGWIVDTTWNLPDLVEAIGVDKLVIDPWPTVLDGHLSGFIFSENLYLSPHASGENLDAAWKFTQYLLSPEAQAWLAQAGRIPAASAAQPHADAPLGAQIAQAMLAMEDGIPYPVLPVIDIYAVQMDIAIKVYLEGGVPPEQALQMAYNAILSELSARVGTPTPSPTP